jgi:hypothetical protein
MYGNRKSERILVRYGLRLTHHQIPDFSKKSGI